MSIAEHLIENALCSMEKGNTNYEDFSKDKLLQEQSKELNIDLHTLWQMCSYILYTYKPSLCEKLEDKIIKDYGYNIYNEDEEVKLLYDIKVYKY